MKKDAELSEPSNFPAIAKVNRIYFVSRHPGAIEWAHRQHWSAQAEFIDHLDTAQIVAHDIVIGTLPIQLASEICRREAHYLHLTFDLAATQRGGELSAQTLEALGAHLSAYQITSVNVPTF